MADNYLERKMEEYRAASLTKKAMHRPVYGVKPGTIVLPYPPQRIFIIGGTSLIGQTVVNTFRKADCRVAFCSNQFKEGNKLAQMSGAKFYPCQDYSSVELCAVIKRVQSDFGGLDNLTVCVIDGNIKCELLVDVTPDNCSVIVVSDSSMVMSDEHINSIVVNDIADDMQRSALSNLCLFLTMPCCSVIKGQQISIASPPSRM